MRCARSSPPAPRPFRDAPLTPARRSSLTVFANALGKPGVSATGAKYRSAPLPMTSKIARAVTASPPSGELGEQPRRARSVSARRAASWSTLKRCQPNDAPRRRATRRARSSAAPRDAATISVSRPDRRLSRNCAAAPTRRAPLEEEKSRTLDVPLPVAMPAPFSEFQRRNGADGASVARSGPGKTSGRTTSNAALHAQNAAVTVDAATGS